MAVACAPSPEPKAETSADEPPTAQPPTPITKFSEPMEAHLTLDYRACESDAECVYAENGCCDCANGGENIAVNRQKLADFRARFRCTGGCTEIGGDCGQGKVACENKLCVYHEPAAN